MTDRELLEKAARAAGMRVTPGVRDGLGRFWADGKVWNPLTDDGDALRLAVKLGMRVWSNQAACSACSGRQWFDEDTDPDPYAATRRAIVRAAADMGER